MKKPTRMVLVLIMTLIMLNSVATVAVALAPDENQAPVVVTAETTSSPSTTSTTVVQTSTKTETTTQPSIDVTTTTTTTKVTTTISNQTVATSSDSVSLLARLIYCEAGGCSYRHKQLVGAVVINRVNSSKFPNTLNGVIYQSGQYSPAMNGKINRVSPDSECYEIARSLLSNGASSICPANVLFQAQFRQGTGVYEVIQSPYGTTTYFCYG